MRITGRSSATTSSPPAAPNGSPPNCPSPTAQAAAARTTDTAALTARIKKLDTATHPDQGPGTDSR
jgi:hypothetical protein